MSELKILEQEGILIEVNGQKVNFKGTISLASGDNLSLHLLGGFKSQSSALRICMATSDEAQTKFLECSFALRTQETYTYYCSFLSGPLCDDASTTYGILRKSILNESKYFHVADGLVPDIMYDILEGCAPYIVKELVKYLISERIVTLQELNDDITAQMWCLCRLLSPMTGDKIPESDLRWQNFLRLLSIMDLLFAPKVSQDDIAYLSVLIEDHHSSFSQHYPSCNITPKIHYMVHYPTWISRCGPLSRFWCMRFERSKSYRAFSLAIFLEGSASYCAFTLAILFNTHSFAS
uniref:Uncharacterized protein n=1 Tax=Amphimedon queenslandica TaxID=400682 RepID=A0A1X7VWZ9_AMPQE